MTSTSDFLNFNVGQLGKKGVDFVPPSELRQYLGTGATLESIQKGKI